MPIRQIINIIRLFLLAVLALSLFNSESAKAAPAGLTLQGRLLKADAPVSGAVTLTVQVTSPTSDKCVLFEEKHNLTLATSEGGVFSIQIGHGTRTSNDQGFSLVNVFSNTGTALTGLVCPGGSATSYTPLASHSRHVYVSFESGTETIAFNDPYVVQSVPYAFEAEKLAGKAASEYLQTTTDTTQTKLNDLMVPATYTELLALLSGSSSKYMTTSNSAPTKLPVLASSPSSPAAGQIWYEAGNLKYYDGSSSSVKTVGTSGGSVTSVATGAGLTGGPITGSGTISLASGVIATPGTYNSVTVDTYGRVTAGTSPTTASGYGITDAVLKGGQTGALTLGTSDANTLTFNTNNSSKMTLLSGGNVGIGTTSPASPLHVVTSGADLGTFSGTGVGRLTLNSSGSNIGFALKTGGTSRFSNAAYQAGTGNIDFVLYNDQTSTNSIFIDGDTNNVGIGTTAPTSNLHVQGTSAGAILPLLEVRNAGATTGTGEEIRLGIGTNSARYNAIGVTKQAAGTNIFDTYFTTANDAGPVERMRIAANGYVGIGTTSPGFLLQVSGSSAALYSAYAPRAPAGSFVNIANTSLTTGSVAGLDMQVTTPGAVIQHAHVAAVATASGYAPDIVIGGSNASGTYAEYIRVNSTGKVGIGTTSPRSVLDVGGVLLVKPAVSNATSTVDFSTGNIQYTSASCGAFVLNNMKDGGSYTFVVQGAVSGTCSFTAYSDVATTALTVHMPPDHDASTASKHTLYSFLVVGTHVYVSWISSL